MKPAMTAEEWAERGTHLGHCDFDGGVIDVRLGGDYGERDTEPDRHALAALALHGQDFGFSWEDVDLLRELSEYWDERVRVYVDGMRPQHAAASGDRRDQLRDLADRIAALLPPREPTRPPS